MTEKWQNQYGQTWERIDLGNMIEGGHPLHLYLLRDKSGMPAQGEGAWSIWPSISKTKVDEIFKQPTLEIPWAEFESEFIAQIGTDRSTLNLKPETIEVNSGETKYVLGFKQLLNVSGLQIGTHWNIERAR